MPEEIGEAARIAAVAAGVGGAARVVLALHGGVRRLGLLMIEAGVGACLGVIAAAGVAYWHPEMWAAPEHLLVVSGAAGLAGALGNRALDAVIGLLGRYTPQPRR